MQDKTPLWNHLGSNKLHTREPSDTTGYIQKQKNFTMRVRLLCGAHVVWDCLFNTGYPGFGVPVPLFIGYLISNLILLKTNTIMVSSQYNIMLCHYVFLLQPKNYHTFFHTLHGSGVLLFNIWLPPSLFMRVFS